MKIIRNLFCIVFLFFLINVGVFALDGSGTADAPYLISDIQDYGKFAAYINSGTEAYSEANYKLTSDLDFKDTQYTVVGTSSNQFNGTFDADGHTIKNVTIDNIDQALISSGNEKAAVGLFGFATNATFKNLCVENITITLIESDITTLYVGFICGSLKTQASVNNVTFMNCASIGSAAILNSNEKSEVYCGGLFGYLNTESKNACIRIIDCYSDVDMDVTCIKTANIGGIGGCASVSQSNIDIKTYRCYVKGKIVSDSTAQVSNIGGIYGVVADGWAGWASEEMVYFSSEQEMTHNLQNLLIDVKLTANGNANKGTVCGKTEIFSYSTIKNNYCTSAVFTEKTGVNVICTLTDKNNFSSSKFLTESMSYDLDNTWTVGLTGPELRIRKYFDVNAEYSDATLKLDVAYNGLDGCKALVAVYGQNKKLLKVVFENMTGPTDNKPIQISVDDTVEYVKFIFVKDINKIDVFRESIIKYL